MNIDDREDEGEHGQQDDQGPSTTQGNGLREQESLQRDEDVLIPYENDPDPRINHGTSNNNDRAAVTPPATLYPGGSLPLLTIMSPIQSPTVAPTIPDDPQQQPAPLLHLAEEDDVVRHEERGSRHAARRSSPLQQQQVERDNNNNIGRNHHAELEWTLSQGRAFSFLLENELTRPSDQHSFTRQQVGIHGARGGDHGRVVEQDNSHTNVMREPTLSTTRVSPMVGLVHDDGYHNHGHDQMVGAAGAGDHRDHLDENHHHSHDLLRSLNNSSPRNRVASSSFLRRRVTNVVRAAVELLARYDSEDQQEEQAVATTGGSSFGEGYRITNSNHESHNEYRMVRVDRARAIHNDDGHCQEHRDGGFTIDEEEDVVGDDNSPVLLSRLNDEDDDDEMMMC